jgi:hypothetical protein
MVMVTIMQNRLTRLAFCAMALAAGAASPVSVVWSASLIYSNSLESGLGDVEIGGACYSYSTDIVGTPVRDGSMSLSVVNVGTKPCVESSGEMKHRAEVRWGSKTEYSALNTPYWFGFSTYVPKDFPTRDQNADAVIVAQWIGGSYGPEMSFQIRGGDTWELRRDWSTGTGDTNNEMTQIKFPVERGVWTDWVVYRERSWKSDGVLRVWKNGVKVVDFVGPTAINYTAHGNGGNVAFKTGIYWGTADRPVTYTMYFDGIRTSSEADGFAMVSPASIAPPPTPTGLQISVQ